MSIQLLNGGIGPDEPPDQAQNEEPEQRSSASESGGDEDEGLPSPPPVQTKMTVSRPDDPLEREADQVAAGVVGGTTMGVEFGQAGGQHRGPLLLRKPDAGAPPGASRAEVAEREVRNPSGGAPLDPHVRRTLESRTGWELGTIRVHDDSPARSASRTLNARAFAHQNHVWLGPGESRTDLGLLAHEVTHAAQQGAVGPRGAGTDRVQRVTRAPGSVVARNGGVDKIIEALDGITSRWDSEAIVAEFVGRSAGEMEALLAGLRARGPDHGLSGDGMIDWLFSDLTAEDRATLRWTLIRAGVHGEINRIIVGDLHAALSGFTSASDSTGIHAILAQYTGGGLESLLGDLATRAEMSSRELGRWLFGDLDRVNAERVRRHFLTVGAETASDMAAEFTASKIQSLLSGYTSRADSSSIVRNFRDTPGRHYATVLRKLELKTRAAWGESAEWALMSDMNRHDYEAMRALGVEVGRYTYPGSWWETLICGAEWVMIVAEWVACGAVGIVTGIVGVIWEILMLLVDVPVAIWHLFWSLVYALTGGVFGSENWLTVKQFFIGIGEVIADPRKAWDAYWETVAIEFETIEGPLADCRRAEYIMRKFAKAVVNVLLIGAAGYGIAKGIASATKTIRAVSRLRLLAGGRLNALRLVRAGGNSADDVARLETMLASRKVVSSSELVTLLKHRKVANTAELEGLLASPRIRAAAELEPLLSNAAVKSGAELRVLLADAKIQSVAELRGLLANPKVGDSTRLISFLGGSTDVAELNRVLALVDDGAQLLRFQVGIGRSADIERLIRTAGLGRPPTADASRLDRVLNQLGPGTRHPVATIQAELDALKKLDSKILFGEPKAVTPPGIAPVGPTQRGLRGVHSPTVLSDPNFQIISQSTNADGTISARLKKLLFKDNSTPPNETWSTPKKSTLAPVAWTEQDILRAGDVVASGPVVLGPRTWGAADNATLHRGVVRGVMWEVIKDSSGKVISSYPTGGTASPSF